MKPLAARRGSAGYSMIELLMVVAIIGLIAAIAVPLYTGAIDKSRRATLVHDAGELHRAFMRYNVDEGVFPSVSAFNLQTLTPLSNGGYFRHFESFTAKLYNGEIQNYDSPNIGGADTQFWATINSASEPGFVLLVAHTNDLPIDRGEWYDGVYHITADGLVTAKETR
ncbi:MAG: prepilin-type N-terminal cleavage/methylation domain-containing protein [Acidobacteria bacterium]|nr:prepilin-type N-terminal cleavage/methylation domain-containing protein [Acidobacteriota bacterium]NIM60727.1 prepilin-type N-terminal cleavage/methylation domain-containing protein [Acidobacteriota bacterium]NIO59547.1 prepilin-type N-terminal cleavage/methylation domain-containing protein [Acidobacteriota bacterium]NIQ30568.1 prepilin-type N-terminal cleavage/methylation domain-containing protein [Acidobacteriota bacterium]NIQ85533.1 prepilin-type N-terminal cleavage/methylation domain-con